MNSNYAKDLIKFIDNSPSQFHATKEAEQRLLENGYVKLDKAKKWSLQKGGKYFITNNSSSFIAFEIGSGDITQEGFRIIGSHTDSPTFRIKPNPEIVFENSYVKLNTEMYGGAIVGTWFDKPLSIAGRVSLKTDDPLKPEQRLVNIDKDLLIIPNLCIHMNRTANENTSYNNQTDVLPIMSTISDELERNNILMELMAKELKVNIDDILDFEVFLYTREKGAIIGLNDEFVSIGKLDNLAMVHASLVSIVESSSSVATKVIIANDNEEIGSMTKQGANSPMLKNLLERIVLGLGLTREDFHRTISNSFIISSDMAHALHPNYAQKIDPTNRPIINRGPAIKIAANCTYTSDGISSSIYKGICEKAGVPYQVFVNRSDMRGGSTIGPITSQQLDIASVDVGNPVLAMHSSRELCGVKDHYYAIQSFKTYFSYK